MTEYRPTVRTQAELERVWRHLMEPLGFGGHSLWLMVIEPTAGCCRGSRRSRTPSGPRPATRPRSSAS